VLPVLGEHARKVVSRVQPYLATHFTAPSGVENVGSRQATNKCGPVAISWKAEQRKGCPRSRCLRSGVYYWTPPSTGTPDTGTPEIRLYRDREVMRRGAGCQRYKASSHRYDREEVINSGGSLPSMCGWRLPRVAKGSHLNGIVARSASPRS
jgi:hypothetical protein